MRMFSADLINLNLEVNDKESAICNLADLLLLKGYVTENFLNGVLEREIKYPTGLKTLCGGFAIPHTDSVHVLKTAIAVARLHNPVIFSEMGGSLENKIEVEIIFMLAIHDPNNVMPILQKVIGIIQNQKIIHQIRQCQSTNECENILNKIYVD